MKRLLSTRRSQLLAAVSLAMVILPPIEAESHCPGSVASVTSRLVQHALIVIPVRVNQAGPFDFMVDTGSQVTVIDPSLAAELSLKAQGRVGLVSVSNVAQASATVLDTLEAGSHVVEETPAIVQDLRQIQAADHRIRGVLGESFLAHFDLFIDYGHKLLCLDETRAMRDSVRGERISFVPPQHPEDELPFMERLVIAVHLSDVGSRPILLQLDSGSNGPILYPGSTQPGVQTLVHAAVLQGAEATATQRAFAVVPPQNMQIGNRILSHISFVTPVVVAKNFPGQHEDGLLPTVLFQRVFISSGDHYVVFDPR
jgi:Aspartyl protease